MRTKITVVKNVLVANDRLAAESRTLFKEKKVFVVNLMSSPGAGLDIWSQWLNEQIGAFSGR
jgi:hydrogenase nickel incorporation protein HypB